MQGRAVGDDARRQAHVRRDRRRGSRPTSARARRSSPTAIYRELSTAVAGSQELSAIAKLYELHDEHDFDVIVLDTPPVAQRAGLPRRARRACSASSKAARCRCSSRPAGSPRGCSGAAPALVFAIFARVTGVDMLGELSRFFRSLSGVIDGFGERTRGVAGAAARRRETTLPDRHLARARAGARGRLPGRSGCAAGGHAARRADRQPRPPRRPRRPLAPSEVAALLRARAGRARWPARVARNLADFDVLARRDRDAFARSRASWTSADPMLVRHLDDDVQDLAGLGPGRRAPLRLSCALDRTLPACALGSSDAALGERRVLLVRLGPVAPRAGSRRRAPRGRRLQMAADHVAQQRAQVVGDVRARAPRRRRARRRCRRSPRARARAPATIRSVSSSAVLGRRAQRGQPPGEQPAGRALGLEQRAQREQVVAQRLVAGSRARSPARSAAAPRRARCRRARGARRGCRTRAARPPARRSRRSIPCGRPPAPSASGLHGAVADPRPARARRARRARRRTGAARAAGRASTARPRAIARCGVLRPRWRAPRPGGSARRSSASARPGRAAPSSASRLGDRQAARPAPARARRSSGRAASRRSVTSRGARQRRAARAARAPRSRRSGRSSKSRLLVEHVREQRPRARRARARVRRPRGRVDAVLAQVAVEPVEALEQPRRARRGPAAARARPRARR